MEKLFSDSETFIKERPTKITEQQEQEFYKSIAQEIIINNWSDDDLEDVIHDVSKISHNDTGYEIAKDLEGLGSKASYNIDTEFIIFLDDFSYRKQNILRKNVEAWVLAHNPKAKFKIGQILIVESTFSHGTFKKGEIAYINGIKEKEACYLIHQDHNYNGGYVIPFEKVEEHCKEK